MKKELSLEQYSNKYKKGKLVKLTKKEIEDFNRDNNVSKQNFNYVLKGKKWIFTNGTYCQIPKPLSITWFRNLSNGIKILILVLLIGAITTAITLPLTIKQPEPTPIITNVITLDKSSSDIEISDNYDYSITATIKDKNSNDITWETTDNKIKLQTNKGATINFKANDYISKDKPAKIIAKYPNADSVSCTITARHNFNTCDWDKISDLATKVEDGQLDYSSFCDHFTIKDTEDESTRKIPTSFNDFVGQEKIVKVNEQDHRVRVIGTEHDELVDEQGEVTGKKATFTFEFANLISDNQGFSLAYQGNDTNDVRNSNKDYINSTLRYALTGKGTNGGKNNNTVLAAQKQQEKWSETYRDKTVLSMLPIELQNVLRTVKKSVGVFEGEDSYNEKRYDDKIFLLSVKEMGYVTAEGDGGFGKAYSYYSEHQQETDPIRIKKQVNGTEKYSDVKKIDSSQGQACKAVGHASNYGGHNYATDYTAGGIYWLSSPYTFPIEWHGKYYEYGFGVDPWGLIDSGVVYVNCFCVAPAFSI